MTFHRPCRIVIEVFSIVGYLCLFLVIPESRAQDEWVFELVDNGKMFDMMSEQSLIVDAQGHSHVAYGGDFLYYARFDGVTWHHETADISACWILRIYSTGFSRLPAYQLSGS